MKYAANSCRHVWMWRRELATHLFLPGSCWRCTRQSTSRWTRWTPRRSWRKSWGWRPASTLTSRSVTPSSCQVSQLTWFRRGSGNLTGMFYAAISWMLHCAISWMLYASIYHECCILPNHNALCFHIMLHASISWCFVLTHHDASLCHLMDASCCYLMNASYCQIMMLHVALWEDPQKAVKRDSS